jgi:hypothetical protein
MTIDRSNEITRKNAVGISAFSQNLSYNQDLIQHFETLHKKELIDWILEYGDKRQLDIVALKYATQPKIDKLFEANKNDIMALLRNKRLMDQGSKLEQKLEEILEKMRNLWAAKGQEIFDLLAHFWQTLANDNEEIGYQDHDNDHFDGSDFVEYMAELIGSFDTDKKLKNFGKYLELEQAVTFEGSEVVADYIVDIFEEEELIELKKWFFENKNHPSGVKISTDSEHQIYKTLESLLNPQEKLGIIKQGALKNEMQFKSLMEYYIQNDQQDEAREYIEKNIQIFVLNRRSLVLELYLDLCIKQKTPYSANILIALQAANIKAELLYKLTKIYTDRVNILESCIEKNSFWVYVRYLELMKNNEKASKIVEMRLKITNYGNYDSYLRKEFFDFYARNSLVLKDQAMAYFEHIINSCVTEPNNNAYKAIVEALAEIKRIDTEVFALYVKDLRTNYSRRSTLMTMLDTLFSKS